MESDDWGKSGSGRPVAGLVESRDQVVDEPDRAPLFGVEDGFHNLPAVHPTGTMLYLEEAGSKDDGKPKEATRIMPPAGVGRSSYSWARVAVWFVACASFFCGSCAVQAWYVFSSMDSQSRNQGWLTNLPYMLPRSVASFDFLVKWYGIQRGWFSFVEAFINLGGAAIMMGMNIFLFAWVFFSMLRHRDRDPKKSIDEALAEETVVPLRGLFPVLRVFVFWGLYSLSTYVGSSVGWGRWYDVFVGSGRLTAAVADRWDHTRPSVLFLVERAYFPDYGDALYQGERVGGRLADAGEFSWVDTFRMMRGQVRVDVRPAVGLCLVAAGVVSCVVLAYVLRGGSAEGFVDAVFGVCSLSAVLLAVGLIGQTFLVHAVGQVRWLSAVLLVGAGVVGVAFVLPAQLLSYWTCVHRRKAHFEWLAGYELVVTIVVATFFLLVGLYGDNALIDPSNPLI